MASNCCAPVHCGRAPTEQSNAMGIVNDQSARASVGVALKDELTALRICDSVDNPIDP